MTHNVYQQFSLEDEGAAAFLNGIKREQCPYNQESQSFQWNHWVYGHDIATSEQAIVNSGRVTFYSTSNFEIPVLDIPVNQAMERGLWKPRYITKRSS